METIETASLQEKIEAIKNKVDDPLILKFLDCLEAELVEKKTGIEFQREIDELFDQRILKYKKPINY